MQNRLKELRQRNSLTLIELGKKVGLANNTLSQYETGKREPKLETWQKLASFFNVSVPYLQGLTLSDNQIWNKVVNHIHVCYFQEYVKKFRTQRQQQRFFYHDWKRVYNLPEFLSNVDIYISFTSKDVLPYKLYKKSELEFKLSEKVVDYWKKNLFPVAKELESRNIYTNTSSYEIFINFTQQLKEDRDKLIHDFDITNYNFCFTCDIDKEKLLHDILLTALKSNDLVRKKVAINNYYKFIRELKRELDNRKEP